MAVMGRPRKEVDFVEFEKLCIIHCTEIEIAAWFEMTVDTLAKRIEEHYGQSFSEVFRDKKAKGRLSLRRKMYQMAMEGNTALTIFMAKNMLGMGDRTFIEANIGGEKEESKLVIQFEDKEEPKEVPATVEVLPENKNKEVDG